MRFHLTPGDFYDISYGGVVNGHRSDGPHSWLIPSDRWEDIEDWHWACQLQQAQAIRFGVEYMRSLEPVNAGTLFWQLNDWLVISWAAWTMTGIASPLVRLARCLRSSPSLHSARGLRGLPGRAQLGWHACHPRPASPGHGQRHPSGLGGPVAGGASPPGWNRPGRSNHPGLHTGRGTGPGFWRPPWLPTAALPRRSSWPVPTVRIC